MGGKNNQAQRTKNNARPSSSGRSAELLGNNASHFSGFSGIKEAGFVMPAFSLPNIKDSDLDIDINLQLVLKKMVKRDTTTKLKALQEFAELIRGTDEELSKAVLPFWPRLYNALATDSEHKVRESTHIAHKEVVQKLKRNLAPVLKQIIAPWFTSQYDTYPPAASAAIDSFNVAFPGNRIEEVVAFCNQEILNYIHDNLLVLTPHVACSSRSTASEDAEAKFERVVISSLLGYSLYLNKIPRHKLEQTLDMNKKIVSSGKFWDYSKHELTVVRAAWYEVLTSLMTKAPFLLEGQEPNVTSTTLGNIDDTDPVVLPLVWQNVLLTITSLKEWWTHVNIDRVMLPKLWKVLKEGGQGNAVVICPHLLPLMSNLPASVDLNIFYHNFFRHLCSGLKQKSVMSSKSESTAVSTAFIECLRYVVMKNISDIILCEKLIESYLIPTIEWCLLEIQSCYRTIFSQTASLIQYWSRNTTPQNSNYSRYLDYFWTNIHTLFEAVLTDIDAKEFEKIFDISEREISFLHSMRNTAKLKKCLRVKFNADSTIGDCDHGDSLARHPDEFFLTSLTKLVFKICEAYFKLVDEKKSRELLNNLVVIIQEFDSRSLFLHISKKIGSPEQNGVMVIFQNLLKNWLDREEFLCRSLVDLIFMTFKYLDSVEKQTVLDSMDQVSNEELLGWCLEEALSHQHSNNPLIKKWLNSEKVSSFLENIAEKVIAHECPSNLSALLKLAVTENANEELHVSHQAISKIIAKLEQPLLNPNNYVLTIDTCASLASYIAAIVYTEKLLLTFGDGLLLALITLSCNANIDPDYISSDTIWEVKTAWQDSFTVLSGCLPKDDLDQVLDRVIAIVQQKLELEDEENKKIEKLIELLTSLCRAIYTGIPLELDRILRKLFNHCFISEWRNSITCVCKAAEYLNGKLTSCYEEFKIQSDIKIDDPNLLIFFKWTYMKFNVLTANLDDCAPDSEEDVEIPVVRIWSVLDSRIDLFTNMLYDVQLGLCFVDHYQTVRCSRKIEDYSQQFFSTFSQLIALNQEDKNALEACLKFKSYSDSWIWCRVFCSFLVTINSEEPTKVYNDLIKNASFEDRLLVAHATQVFGKYLNFDFVSHTFDDVSRMIFLRCLSHCQEIDVQIAEVMSKLELFRSENVAMFNCVSEKIDWVSYQFILEAARLFNSLMKHQFDSLSRRYLDLIIICLAEWLPHLVQFYKLEKAHAMIIAVTELHQSIAIKMVELKCGNTSVTLTKEWDCVFAEGIQKDLVRLWICHSENFKHNPTSATVTALPLMYSFAEMTGSFNHQLLFKNCDEESSSWPKLLKESCCLLTSPLTTLQLSSYNTIMNFIPGLVEVDSVAVNTNTPNSNGLVFEKFKDVCILMQDIIDTMLIELKLGEDSCRVEPYTDSYNYTLAYLLIWDILLALCENASTELKYQYADWLKKEDILKNLFNNLFRLMPSEILQHADIKKMFHTEWFSLRPSLGIKEVCTSAKIEQLVCWIYFLTMSQLPALVRQWWSGTEPRIAQIVDRITSTYVSPLLCNQELSDVNIHQKKFKNMSIKVMPTVREVVAVYSVDDAQMELVITLPTNYPLSGPGVHCNRQIGGTTHKQWLMQFKKCVLHQNGHIWDGLSLWNNNLDKKFDGVEECYICFSVLHPGTYQLPKLSCQTCKKKFHSACLYKWFSTSNKSSCPICRNLF